MIAVQNLCNLEMRGLEWWRVSVRITDTGPISSPFQHPLRSRRNARMLTKLAASCFGLEKHEVYGAAGPSLDGASRQFEKK